MGSSHGQGGVIYSWLSSYFTYPANSYYTSGTSAYQNMSPQYSALLEEVTSYFEILQFLFSVLLDECNILPSIQSQLCPKIEHSNHFILFLS